MSKIFSIKIDENSDAEVMVMPSQGNVGAQAWGTDADIVERASGTLAGALDMVRMIGQCAVTKFSDLDVQSVEATVGLKLTGKGKFVIAEASAEATLNVKFTLKRSAQ